MVKWFLVGLSIVISFHFGYGQNLPPIQLDRPDQTECPFITPAKYIQIETGFLYENIDSKNKLYVHPTSLWKYGINEKFELRLITEFTTEKNESTSTSGLQPITLGFKTRLFEEKGIIPLTSFIGHITTAKIGTKRFHTNYIAPSFRFTMQHMISKKVILAYNLGAEWDGETPRHTYLYTLTTGISLTEKFGFYAELYGFLPADKKGDHRVDSGFTFQITNDCIIDLSGGFGLTDNASDNYLSLGFSYRFKTNNK